MGFENEPASKTSLLQKHACFAKTSFNNAVYMYVLLSVCIIHVQLTLARSNIHHFRFYLYVYAVCMAVCTGRKEKKFPPTATANFSTGVKDTCAEKNAVIKSSSSTQRSSLRNMTIYSTGNPANIHKQTHPSTYTNISLSDYSTQL